MSPSIWTRCGGRANLRRIVARAWRVVEGQHVVSTRRLVDSREEQIVLEQLLEESKPRLPEIEGIEGLHYLLYTPFRYPPLRHGSRFGTRAEPSLWYGSSRPRTAFAETAFYRLYFLEGTTAELGALRAEFSLFRVPLRTGRGADLSRPPFTAHRARIASPVEYAATQRLGSDMRDDGVEVIRYPSARDRAGGLNLAVFTPRAFAATAPDAPQAWHCVATRSAVEFTRKDFFDRHTFRFPREDFEVAGRLPMPAP